MTDTLIPGELMATPGEIELNAGRKTAKVTVANTGAVTFTGVNLEDDLPIGVTYVSNSAAIQSAVQAIRHRISSSRVSAPASTCKR